jgi:GxxExxY protein
MTAETKLLHREETKEIIDSAYKVHNVLGCGLLEKVYGNALTLGSSVKEDECNA